MKSTEPTISEEKETKPDQKTNELWIKKVRDIRRDYDWLFKGGLRNEIITDLLQERYYMLPDTILQIVFKRGRYKDVG